MHAPSATDPGLAATLKVEAMLVAAEKIGLDLFDLEVVRRRLMAHEVEQRRTWPSPRRRELDRLVEADLEALCEAFAMLAGAAERPT